MEGSVERPAVPSARTPTPQRHLHDLWTSVPKELNVNSGSGHCPQQSWQIFAKGHWRWCEVLIHWRNLHDHDRRTPLLTLAPGAGATRNTAGTIL